MDDTADPSSDAWLSKLARQISLAQNTAQQIAPLSLHSAGLDVPSAYRIAALVHAQRLHQGAVAVGRKIGFTNAALWPVYGVGEPIWAHVYDRTVTLAAGASAVCSLAGLVEPKVEPEIVLRLRACPRVGGDASDVLACIDAVALGFEIVQSHYPGWKFTAADAVADASLHGRLIIGPPQPVEVLGPDLVGQMERFKLGLHEGPSLRDSGVGANVLGSPLRAIAHLAALLNAQPNNAPLRAGEWITTGTVTMAHTVTAGQRWHARVEGLALPALTLLLTD